MSSKKQHSNRTNSKSTNGEKSYYIQPKRKAFADYMLQTVKGKVAVVDDIFKVKEDIL